VETELHRVGRLTLPLEAQNADVESLVGVRELLRRLSRFLLRLGCLSNSAVRRLQPLDVGKLGELRVRPSGLLRVEDLVLLVELEAAIGGCLLLPLCN